MNIAAVYENGQICQDLARARQFKLYPIEGDHIGKTKLIDAEEPIPACLNKHGAGLLVCGRLTSEQQAELLRAGIAPFPGAYGDADLQVGALFVRMIESEKQQSACPEPEKNAGCAGCAHRASCSEYQA